MLWWLGGLSKNRVIKYAQSYYINMVKPHQITRTVEILHELQREGWRIVLVSGGYDVYIEFFAKDNGINKEDIFASTIGFKYGLCTGRLNGPDCMGFEKIKRIENHFKKDQINSIAFSDGESDLPMLNWANDCFVVSKQQQQWAINNNLKQIIW